MNVGQIVDRSRSGAQGFGRTAALIALSYAGYVAFAVLLHATSKVIHWSSSTLLVTLLVVLFFGNQNTKAFLRQQDLVSGRVASNNIAVTVGLAGKCGLALLLLPFGLEGMLGAVCLVDVLMIILMGVSFVRSHRR